MVTDILIIGIINLFKCTGTVFAYPSSESGKIAVYST